MQFSNHQDKPYAFWAHVRAQKGLVFDRSFTQNGAWLVSRYADCEQVLKDTQRFSVQRTGAWIQTTSNNSDIHHADSNANTDANANEQQRSTARSLFARALLFTDAPTHTQLRRIMQPLFKPSALHALRADIHAWAQQSVDVIQSSITQTGKADFVALLAQPFPAKVIAKLIGIEHLLYPNNQPTPLVAQFQRWSQHLARFIGAPYANAHQIKAAQISIAEMADFFDRVCKEKNHSHDSLIGVLKAAEQQNHISRDELLAQAVMMLFAGHETTRNLLSNGLLALLQQRDQWEKLCANPDGLATSCTRELLRWDTPIQYTGRRVTQNCTLAGQELKRNDVLILALASANHDDDTFNHADTLDITRKQAKPLSFGLGTHHCIGALLTEMETQTVLQLLAAQLPNLRLEQYRRNTSAPAYRGLDSLFIQTH